MPTQIPSLLKQGLAFHRQGKFAEAKAIYETVLQKDPRHFDALNLLGTLAAQTGNFEAAAELTLKASAINPNVAPPYNNRGNALLALNRLDEALACYERALALNPAYAETHCNRGNVLWALDRPREAVASYDHAVALNPSYTEAFHKRGNVLLGLKQLDEALASFDKVLALDPHHAEGHQGRGIALSDLGRPGEALASYDMALAINPGFAEVHNSRGYVLEKLDRLEDALASYERALALSPDRVEFHNNRGNLLLKLDRPEDAIGSHDAALALNPNHAEGHIGRGLALKQLGDVEGALASHIRALALAPDHENLFGATLELRARVCDWEGLATAIETVRSAILASRKVCTPFTVLALLDEPQLHKQAAMLNARMKHPGPAALGPIAKRARREKIRVGYYSADFYNHATAFLMAELFEAHDSSRFEFFAFSFGPNKQDEMRRRVSSAFDNFLDVANESDQAVARRSRELGIDIAVDLKGYTQDGRSGIFAERSAPIQVSYLGYPGTTGAEYIDYVIADEIVIPTERQGDFTEKVIYLPHSYQINDSQRKISERAFTRKELGLPDSGFVFCCFNNSYKILPSTFETWMSLLKTVEGSVLWLYENHPLTARNLRKEAAARGVDNSRLVFATHMPLDQHLARHRLADLFLDTLPYNAHTTASDALWAGLPVLTRQGKSFASRVAASLLHAVGLPELVTNSQEEYVAKALELARDSSKLAEIKSKLARNRLSSSLFDAKLFARHIEAAYTAIYERYQADLPPEAFKISDR